MPQICYHKHKNKPDRNKSFKSFTNNSFIIKQISIFFTSDLQTLIPLSTDQLKFRKAITQCSVYYLYIFVYSLTVGCYSCRVAEQITKNLCIFIYVLMNFICFLDFA